MIAEDAFNLTFNQFYLLLGEDALSSFMDWYLPEEIVKLVPLLIGSRSAIPAVYPILAPLQRRLSRIAPYPGLRPRMRRNPRDLLSVMEPSIGDRAGIARSRLRGEELESKKNRLNHFPLSIRHAITEGLTPTHLFDISSSDIRIRLAQDLYCGHLVPSPVLEYIRKNALYYKCSL